MRLQKFLAHAGLCSRRKGEEHIKAGLVTVNGLVVTELGTKVDPEKDRIEFNGKPVQIEHEKIYLAINKPAGYVTSCSQPREKIIVDLVNISRRLYPVGRLDKDSTGLLILTNDGDLHQKLSHPSFDHEKEYDVTVESRISDSALNKIASGIMLDSTKTRPAVIKRISQNRFKIILKEGRNRQIRRMVKKVGNKVVALNRIRVANIHLKKLAQGSWRYLTKKEIKNLMDIV